MILLFLNKYYRANAFHIQTIINYCTCDNKPTFYLLKYIVLWNKYEFV